MFNVFNKSLGLNSSHLPQVPIHVVLVNRDLRQVGRVEAERLVENVEHSPAVPCLLQQQRGPNDNPNSFDLASFGIKLCSDGVLKHELQKSRIFTQCLNF